MTVDISSFQCIPLVVYDTSGLTGTFEPINGSGFAQDIKILKYYNGGTEGITLSYDGVTSHDYFPAGATFILDLQTNHADNASNGSGTLYGRKGQIIWAMGTAGTGNFYISGYR